MENKELQMLNLFIKTRLNYCCLTASHASQQAYYHQVFGAADFLTHMHPELAEEVANLWGEYDKKFQHIFFKNH